MLRNTALAGLAAAVLGMAAAAAPAPAMAQEVVVGGKNFTEQQLLTEMTAQLLEAKGYDVDRRAGMGSAVVREAMESGQVDVYWEYVGTSLIVYNKIEEPMAADPAYDKVKEMDAAKGIAWLDRSNANNTYALAMQEDEAQEMGISTISDLAASVNGGKALTFASNAEFYARPDGLAPLQETYGFEFGRDAVSRMDSGLTYQALKDDQADVALVFATDGRIPAFGFRVLQDDKGFFPNYALTPVARQETLDAHPDLAGLLNGLAAKLDDPTMARLNAEVDVDGKSIEDVSREFLTESGLV